jgi:hypothetical protein
MKLQTLFFLSFLLCGANAFAQDASCAVHVGTESVDASQVTKAWTCGTDPRGVHPAVCITTKTEPQKTRLIAMPSSKDADESAKAIEAIAEGAKHCGP